MKKTDISSSKGKSGKVLTETQVRQLRYKKIQDKKQRTQYKKTNTRSSNVANENEAVEAEAQINRKVSDAGHKVTGYAKNAGKEALKAKAKENTKKKATQEAIKKAAAKKAATSAVTAGATVASATPAAPVALPVAITLKIVDAGRNSFKKLISAAKGMGEDVTSGKAFNHSAFALLAVLVVPFILLFVMLPVIIAGSSEKKDAGKIFEDQIGEYICPIPTEYPHHISSPYNSVRYIHTETAYSVGVHYGTDISGANIYGVPVVAVADGIAIVPPYNAKGYGNYVVLETEKDLDFYYGHLADIVVSNGEEVEQGQVLGHVGSTGNSTGPHLHFEARNLRNGTSRAQQNIDPVVVLNMRIENHEPDDSSEN